MTSRWNIADVLDLEYLLALDGEEDPNLLAGRDRSIFLESAETGQGRETADPGPILLQWLRHRRRLLAAEDGTDTVLPGRLWQEVYRLARLLALLAGLVFGGGLAYSFLSYTGVRPVNVALYFAGFILSQLTLLLLIAVTALYRILFRRGLQSSLLYGLLVRLLAAAVLRLKGAVLRRLDGRRRLSLQAALGSSRMRLHAHGALLFWPAFILVQLFAVGFNTGVLGATLLKVATADIAFGWQSTLQVGAATVARLVRLIALPWSWFVPAHIACPSLSQVEGSRMVLKEGIYHLATADLVSWWPFLCLSVVFYGLLPRICLLVAGHLGLRRALDRLSFDSPACRRLLRRMLTPTLRTGTGEDQAAATADSPRPVEKATRRQTGAGGREPDLAPVTGEEDGAGKEAGQAAGREKAQGREAAVAGPEPHRTTTLLVLVPDELQDHCPSSLLDDLVRERTGASLGRVLVMGGEDEDPEALLVRIRNRCAGSGPDGILVIQEAWQPPIREFMVFLAGLRELLGPGGVVVVALVGKPAPGGLFAPVRPLDREIWQQSLAALAVPGLEVMEVVRS
ncbi:DUF2868 domain-containing protein [Thermodesulfobacteriota bacterium B35]